MDNQQITAHNREDIPMNQGKVEYRLSRIVSYLFHPILIPTYAYAILSNTSIFRWLITPQVNIYIIALLFTITAIVPSILFYFMKQSRLIKSFRMETRQERVYPLLLLTLIYFTTYIYIKQSPIFLVASTMLFFATITSLVAFFINFFIKVSLHCMGVSSFIAIALMIALYYGIDLTYLIIIAILIAGIVGTSRLKLEAHKPTEVYLGYMIGIITIIITSYFII